MINPGLKSSIGGSDLHKTQELAADNDAYHTQEGVKAGPRDLIIGKAPKVTIKELEHKDFGFMKVKPPELLQHIKDQADVIDAVNLNTKLEEQNKAIDFEGKITLKTFFQLVDNRIKELKKYNVAFTHNKIMVRYLLQFE